MHKGVYTKSLSKYTERKEPITTIRVLPGQIEWSRPKHDVTEGIMTLPEDMKPEATLLIGLS